jgi:hypothetical protein
MRYKASQESEGEDAKTRELGEITPPTAVLSFCAGVSNLICVRDDGR